MRLRLYRWPIAIVLALLPASTVAVSAQGLTGPSVADSTVGYIDNAIPGNVFRLRFDAGYNMNFPSRAEFFYAAGQPTGRGLPLAETNVDYQDINFYVEGLVADRFSVFISEPIRFLNPEINANARGFSDLDAGFKYAFIEEEMRTVSFQFRTYIPTANSKLGLGTGHTSLEPALLFYQGLSERWALAGEARYWVPLGGSFFAGDIVRYGLGLQYKLYEGCRLTATPVTEFVGWTVLNGREGDVPFGRDAGGSTIVNIKFGCRWGFSDRCDLYTGVGESLTGDRWYRDLFRTEFRVLY